jgi:hypothetical protein
VKLEDKARIKLDLASIIVGKGKIYKYLGRSDPTDAHAKKSDPTFQSISIPLTPDQF